MDIHLCVDRDAPANCVQGTYVKAENCDLFFSELRPAFSTHSCLGAIHVYHRRTDLSRRLEALAREDETDAGARDAWADGIAKDQVFQSALADSQRSLYTRLCAMPSLRSTLRAWLPPWALGFVRRLAGRKLRTAFAKLNDHFVVNIHSHDSINAFAARHKRIPQLAPALGCAPDVAEFLTRRLAGKMVVPFHLRL